MTVWSLLRDATLLFREIKSQETPDERGEDHEDDAVDVGNHRTFGCLLDGDRLETHRLQLFLGELRYVIAHHLLDTAEIVVEAAATLLGFWKCKWDGVLGHFREC